MTFTDIIADHDVIAIDLLNNAVFLGKHADTRVVASTVFHTSSDNRRFGNQKRNSLTLHVGTHQSTRSVIVLKEGDHGCSDGYHLTR